MKIFTYLMAAALLLSGTLMAAEKVRNNEELKKVQSENMAADFSLSSLDGKTIKLSDYRGKVVILNFWATWCPPCKAEIPDFIQLYNKEKDNGLVIIGVALDEPDKVKKFAKNHKITYPIVMGDAQTAADYGGIRGIPTTFMIDKNGAVQNIYTGYRPQAVFALDFKKLN